MNSTPYSVSCGAWHVDTSSGLNVILATQDDSDAISFATQPKQLAIVEEFHDAVLMASVKAIFEALIEISVRLERIEDPALRDELELIASDAFEKINAEVS